MAGKKEKLSPEDRSVAEEHLRLRAPVVYEIIRRDGEEEMARRWRLYGGPGSRRGSEFWIIVAFTYLIALGDFTLVVAGSAEVFLLQVNGGLGVADGIFGPILPTFIGNIIGGTGLFALLAYGQVHEEI